MPNLKNGLEVELGGTSYWYLAYPRGDLAALLNCPRRELNETLQKLRDCSVLEEDVDAAAAAAAALGMVREAARLTKGIAHQNVRSQATHGRHCRPTASLLFAVLAMTCHVCQEEVVLSDLLRWARLLKLPLLDMGGYMGQRLPTKCVDCHTVGTEAGLYKVYPSTQMSNGRSLG